ncbi:FAD-dependent oxidoreductase [bacterium]|nr:FAD-binding protein [Candidatus Omnitrophota bacterium]MBU2529110.1 FAD-dependent oxidoreductase [bacterium]MBU3929457.1 FAD-dependent oxidoreductase [bacterium]MBU4122846.1 FAD-dependent oxidoreductase [bacterium]
MTEMQFKAELAKCEYCEERPCESACPANCSPFEFIMASKEGEAQDYLRAASAIMKSNPLGGVCGTVCPDRHCMAKCSHKDFDGSVKIPEVQAYIIQKAGELGGIPCFNKAKPKGEKIAVIGAGPAGLAAAAVLSQKGYQVAVFEKNRLPGGACNLIPAFRLDRKIIKTDIDFIKALGSIEIRTGQAVKEATDLLKKGYKAVISATGLWAPILPGIENQGKAVNVIDYLINPKKYKFAGKVAVIGGGASAVDCAVTAKKNGASKVEMFILETVSEMPLSAKERVELLENGIELTNRTSVTAIKTKSGKISGLTTVKVDLAAGKKFALKDLKTIPGTEQSRNDIKNVIIAIGTRAEKRFATAKGVFSAGDYANGPTTVVEAVASGKNAAEDAAAYLAGKKASKVKKDVKSTVEISGYEPLPVSLETDFFGRKINSPFLLSAAPPSDGYDQMKKAYEAGWAGGIMKTAFDGGGIHIPGEYMHTFNDTTYGNCDNVSGHTLTRVCGEVKKLVKEFPDRLTMASTGGPVTGNDKEDKKGWQANTKKLENAGVMGIEYSLSCPQGGDGTEGDIVSQNAALTARIIDWVMEVSDPKIPKLFKLTGAVTSIVPIARAIKEVFDKYPGKKAGITLANTFPVVDFRPGKKGKWDEAIVFGMSGEAVAPISYNNLVCAMPVGLSISGNGGPMNYKQASHFLAIGVKTVQFCTMPTKYGYGIYDELCSGVSYLMKQRGIKSMKDLIGIAQPNPITGFMDISPTKKISSLIDKEICLSCGNCARCPYQAISLDKDGFPEIDPAKCIGCSICTKKCFTGALEMRKRTPKEMKQLKED